MFIWKVRTEVWFRLGSGILRLKLGCVFIYYFWENWINDCVFWYNTLKPSYTVVENKLFRFNDKLHPKASVSRGDRKSDHWIEHEAVTSEQILLVLLTGWGTDSYNLGGLKGRFDLLRHGMLSTGAFYCRKLFSFHHSPLTPKLFATALERDGESCPLTWELRHLSLFLGAALCAIKGPEQRDMGLNCCALSWG